MRYHTYAYMPLARDGHMVIPSLKGSGKFNYTVCLGKELEIFGKQQALRSLGGASTSFSPLCLFVRVTICSDWPRQLVQTAPP